MVHGDASKMDAPISPWAGGSHVWVEEDHDVSPVGRGVVGARAALEDVRAERFVDASLGFGGAVPVEEGRPLFGVLVDHGVAVAVSHVGETGRDDFEGEVGPASAQTSTRRRRGTSVPLESGRRRWDPVDWKTSASQSMVTTGLPEAELTDSPKATVVT